MHTEKWQSGCYFLTFNFSFCFCLKFSLVILISLQLKSLKIIPINEIICFRVNIHQYQVLLVHGLWILSVQYDHKKVFLYSYVFFMTLSLKYFSIKYLVNFLSPTYRKDQAPQSHLSLSFVDSPGIFYKTHWLDFLCFPTLLLVSGQWQEFYCYFLWPTPSLEHVFHRKISLTKLISRTLKISIFWCYCNLIFTVATNRKGFVPQRIKDEEAVHFLQNFYESLGTYILQLNRIKA